MFLLEESRIFSTIEALARFPAHKIAQLVARDGAQRYQRQQLRQLHMSGSGEYPRRHQQGIAREEKTDEEPRLGEHDHANQQRPAPFDQSADVIELRQQMPHEFDHRPRFPALPRTQSL